MKIELFRDNLRLRFTHQRTRFSITIGKNTMDNRELARKVIDLLNADIKSGRFDSTLFSYKNVTIAVDSSGFPMAELYRRWLVVFGQNIPYNVISTQKMIDKWVVKVVDDIPVQLINQQLAAYL